MTPPPEKGTYYAHPLTSPIVGLLKNVFIGEGLKISVFFPNSLPSSLVHCLVNDFQSFN